MRKAEYTWECGFCKKTEVTSYDQIPPGWRSVELDGLEGEWRKQDLCESCMRTYRGYLKELQTFATDFWWCRVRMLAIGEKPREIKIPWK